MISLQALGLLSIAITVAGTMAAFWGSGATSGAGQTRRGAIIEAWCNVAIGFGVNWCANWAILPLVGASFTAAENFWMGCIYTAISVARSFALRRWFNARLHAASMALAARLG